MKIWIVFFLASAAYFFQKYSNRRDKTKPKSLSFYIKENWSRFAWTYSFDLILMIILMDAETQIDMSPLLAKLPFGVVLSGKLLLSAAIGYGVAFAAYRTRKKKTEIPNE